MDEALFMLELQRDRYKILAQSAPKGCAAWRAAMASLKAAEDAIATHKRLAPKGDGG